MGWLLHGLGIVMTCGAALLAEFVLFRPIDGRADACLRRTDELRTLLKEEARIRREHARLSRPLAEARQRAATLQRRIPDEPQEAVFLAQVSHLAGEVGLQIRDYRPGAITRQPSYCAMRIDLICEGDYAGICKFVGRLVELPRHSVVVRMEIDSTGRGKVYAAELTLEIFFYGTAQPGASEKGVENA